MNDWLEKLYETFLETGYYTLMLEGLSNTVIITLGALAIGVVIGTSIAVIKTFAEDVPALKPLTFLRNAYVNIIRGVPVVVLHPADALVNAPVLLDGDDAELRLREAVEKNRFDINTRSKVVYAVNVGLDDETARACEMMSHDNPQIVFCRPEQLGELIRQY